RLRLEIGAEVFDKRRYFAARRGTVMHKWLELFLEYVFAKGLSPEEAMLKCQEEAPKEFEGWTNKELTVGRNLFYNFYHDIDPVTKKQHWMSVKKLLHSELFMYTTLRGGWAGTTDFVFLDNDDKLVIWDFKSASDMREEGDTDSYKLQLAAYMFQ